MKKSLPACLLAFYIYLLAAAPALAQNSFYTDLTTLLQQHVQAGQVDYQALQRKPAQLQRLVRQIASYDLGQATAAERKAFYLNAYNVLVLQQVLDHYPLTSVKDVNGFFDKRQFPVAGETLTLNQLEKQKLLAPFHDARVHFALVCAAKSCPPLLSEAYMPERVEQQLESQTREALQNTDFIRAQPRQQRVLLPEIFNWYKPDFLREAPSVTAYINRYRRTPLPTGYRLGYYPYDWSLNDKK